MTTADRWLLPDGVEEVLPPEAHKLETLRRLILDLYSTWGYELVITPLIEYLDSLLVGSSHDLDLHTFKITDQLSGRMMGVRADITPQVARIDAHSLHRIGPVRLCYADNVLHTKPRGLLTSRVPIKIGAEMFGHSGVGCDIELISLMISTLQQARIGELHLVLGHVGIFRRLVEAAGLNGDAEQALFDALQRKACGEIDVLLQTCVSDQALRNMISRLPALSGEEAVLEEAQQVFADAPESIRNELAELAAIAAGVRRKHPQLSIGFDLCELRGYQYHTGIVFAAYNPAYGRAIAKGGRYDEIGKVFGRARPASGFDADLKIIARLSRFDSPPVKAIFAPGVEDTELAGLISALRAQGERVIVNLEESEPERQVLEEMNCDRRLVQHDGVWGVVGLQRS